jgi:exopolysaccharide biosynthesis polyprenyl glycosylphosphotransferase
LLRDRAGELARAIRWLDAAIVVGVFFAFLGFSGARWNVGNPAEVARLFALGVAACLPWPLALERLGLYRSQRRAQLSAVLGRLALASLVPTVATAAVTILAGLPFPARVAALCTLGQVAALAAQRTLILVALRILRRSGRNVRYVLIVGAGPRAREVSARIADHPEWGLRIVGFIDDSGAPLVPEIPAEEVHKPQDFARLLEERVIDEVIVAYPRSLLASIERIVGLCAATGVPLTLLCDLFGDFLPPPRISRLGPQAALSFAPTHHPGLDLAIKRALDIVGAATLLLVSAPLIALAGLLVRATSPGPIFFRQVRCGLYGRRIGVWKLRTMCVDAEARQAELQPLNEMDGPVFKLRDDPRVTPVGRWLRRFSIDELPQLWNVLKGEMSLVGPRPPVPGEVSQYDPADRRRLSMRPGITCIWQVNGRNRIGFDEWVKLDLEYIDNWSLGLDLVLLLKTIPAVLGGKGAS